MKYINKWFESFLESFPKNKEVRISEKQFNVFVKNSMESFERGYTEIFRGLQFETYSWESVNGTRYYVTVK